jgi:hypothetical protein
MNPSITFNGFTSSPIDQLECKRWKETRNEATSHPARRSRMALRFKGFKGRALYERK